MKPGILGNEDTGHQVKGEVMNPAGGNHGFIGKKTHNAIQCTEAFKSRWIKTGYYEPGVNDGK
jgi:hypothetical protein